MFTYIVLCRDVFSDGNVTGPYVSDDTPAVFNTFEEAYNAAIQAANEEAEGLLDGLDDVDSGCIDYFSEEHYTSNGYDFDEVSLLYVNRYTGIEGWITKRIIVSVK